MLIALVCCAGCADPDWGYVTGTVTVSGQPVGPGSLMFDPVRPGDNTTTSAIAHFREDGRYELKSAGNRTGAPAGEYRVMIHGRSEEAFGDEAIDSTTPSQIPARYMDYSRSGLTASVQPGRQEINFELAP